MRILILGGTRFIGPPTVRRLHAQGHTLALFHRTRTDNADLPTEVTHILGNRREDFEAHAPAFRDFEPDVVLDMFPITEADAQAVMRLFTGYAGRVVAISSQHHHVGTELAGTLQHGRCEDVVDDHRRPGGVQHANEAVPEPRRRSGDHGRTLAGGWVEHAGVHYSFGRLRMEPSPAVPVLLPVAELACIMSVPQKSPASWQPGPGTPLTRPAGPHG